MYLLLPNLVKYSFKLQRGKISCSLEVCAVQMLSYVFSLFTLELMIITTCK